MAADSGSGGRPSPCRRAGHLLGWAGREAGAPQLLEESARTASRCFVPRTGGRSWCGGNQTVKL